MRLSKQNGMWCPTSIHQRKKTLLVAPEHKPFLNWWLLNTKLFISVKFQFLPSSYQQHSNMLCAWIPERITFLNLTLLVLNTPVLYYLLSCYLVHLELLQITHATMLIKCSSLRLLLHWGGEGGGFSGSFSSAFRTHLLGRDEL